MVSIRLSLIHNPKRRKAGEQRVRDCTAANALSIGSPRERVNRAPGVLRTERALLDPHPGRRCAVSGENAGSVPRASVWRDHFLCGQLEAGPCAQFWCNGRRPGSAHWAFALAGRVRGPPGRKGRVQCRIMWRWLVQNKEWVFSGVGLTVLATIWWVLTKLLPSRRGPSPGSANSVTQAPTITVSPTFNISQEARTPEQVRQEPPAPVPASKARANLRVEATKIGKPWLQEDVWTLAPDDLLPKKRYKGLLADLANVPRASGNIKAVKVRASLTIGSRNYSPLPWLAEYTNVATLQPAARKTVLLAAGDDEPMGPWYFVLNHRERYTQAHHPSMMDWTNMAPINRLPMEIVLVDVDSGELVAKFEYLWTFDSTLGFPILKTAPGRDE